MQNRWTRRVIFSLALILASSVAVARAMAAGRPAPRTAGQDEPAPHHRGRSPGDDGPR